MLVAEALAQEYGGVRIISDITLVVPAGGVTVLLGKSGSGKTTVLRTISLVDEPVSGSITVGERRFFPRQAGAQQPSMWPTVTTVFQQFPLWPHMPVGQNVELPARLRGLALGRLHELCERLGIVDLLGRYPHEISVGQRQRAALARAVMLQPRYLLLDEITSSQDVHHVGSILATLKEEILRGAGALVVSHHLGFVRQLLSMAQEAHVVFLVDGRVVEHGDASVLDSPVTEYLRSLVELSRGLA